MREVSAYEMAILRGLQSKPMYAGTVPHEVKVGRRKRNKAARVSRRINRAA